MATAPWGATRRRSGLDEETQTLYERVLGPEHPHTLTSRSNLAIGYRDLGRYEEAVRLCKETLSIRERVLAPEHPDTLTSRKQPGRWLL